MRGEKGCGKRRKESGNGIGCMISILMRGVRTERHSFTLDGLVFYRNDFFRIDIHNNNDSGDIIISSNQCFDSQYDCNGGGSTLLRVSGSSRIYNLPITLNADDINKIPDNIEGIHCLKGVSWVDLSDTTPNPKWSSGPIRECYVFPHFYACLGHNIYTLWLGCLSEPMVLNTTNNNKDSNGWVLCIPPFPVDDLELRDMTGNILSDTRNQRIIFQLTDTDIDESLPVTYAWYPENHPPRWETITDDIDLGTWRDNLPTLVDDIIFFHSPNVFSAFHLKHKKWMRVCLSKSHSWPPHLVCRRVDNMLYLGQSRLCLVFTHQLVDDIHVFFENPVEYVLGINVYLDVFHIQPHPSDPLHVNIAHSFTKSITFDDIVVASDFLPLGASFDD